MRARERNDKNENVRKCFYDSTAFAGPFYGPSDDIIESCSASVVLRVRLSASQKFSLRRWHFHRIKDDKGVQHTYFPFA